MLEDMVERFLGAVRHSIRVQSFNSRGGEGKFHLRNVAVDYLQALTSVSGRIRTFLGHFVHFCLLGLKRSQKGFLSLLRGFIGRYLFLPMLGQCFLEEVQELSVRQKPAHEGLELRFHILLGDTLASHGTSFGVAMVVGIVTFATFRGTSGQGTTAHRAIHDAAKRELRVIAVAGNANARAFITNQNDGFHFVLSNHRLMPSGMELVLIAKGITKDTGIEVEVFFAQETVHELP